MRHTRVTRIAISGILWAAVYNAIWGVAWFTFMRREWESAFAAVGRPLAWSADVWLIWIVVTVPLGLALMAYADGGSRPLARSLFGAVLLLFLFSLGMTVWGIQESLSLQVLALDALVNVVAMPAASLVAVEALTANAAPGAQPRRELQHDPR